MIYIENIPLFQAIIKDY